MSRSSTAPVVEGYFYSFSCVDLAMESVPNLHAMIEDARDISYPYFRRLVGGAELDLWAKAHHYDTGNDRGGLRLKDDWHVSYHRSTYAGCPVCYLVWSGIECVFTPFEFSEAVVRREPAATTWRAEA